MRMNSGREKWVEALNFLRTTAQAASFLAPQVSDLTKSFAEDCLGGSDDVAMATDFVSHAWHGHFRALSRPCSSGPLREIARGAARLVSISSTRYYWIDIFVEPDLKGCANLLCGLGAHQSTWRHFRRGMLRSREYPCCHLSA